VALFVNKAGITIKAKAEKGIRIPLRGAGFDYSGRGSVPRAIVQFNKGADGCVIEGFTLSGAHNESHNGAGIRINGANDIIVRHCEIHGNDMGIMSNGDGTRATAVNQLIEGCLIHGNGAPADPGYNHNLYLGGTSVTLLGCEVHSSLTGHNIKSRAHVTRIIACYVHDSANREIDLVDGKSDTTIPESDAWLEGNTIVKGEKGQGNRGVIHFGQDGGHEHDGTLYLRHNTIVTPFISPVVQLSSKLAKVRLFNNIISDGGTHRNGQVLLSLGDHEGAPGIVGGSNNWLASGFQGAATESWALPHTVIGEKGTWEIKSKSKSGSLSKSKTHGLGTRKAGRLPLGDVEPAWKRGYSVQEQSPAYRIDFDSDSDFDPDGTHFPQAAEHLLKCHCGLTHLHEDGLPFYLPAAMTWVLKNFRDTNEMLTDSTIYQLEKKGLCDHYDWRFRLFTLAQWRACRSFLEYLLHEDRDRNWIDSDVAKLALDTVKAKIQALTIVAPEKPATGFESP
jgi:hypothetical protein